MARLAAMLQGSGPDAPLLGDLRDRNADPSVLQVSTPDWVEEGVLCEELVRFCRAANVAKTVASSGSPRLCRPRAGQQARFQRGRHAFVVQRQGRGQAALRARDSGDEDLCGGGPGRGSVVLLAACGGPFGPWRLGMLGPCSRRGQRRAASVSGS